MKKTIDDTLVEQQLLDYVNAIDIPERLAVEMLDNEKGIPYARIGEVIEYNFNTIMDLNSEAIGARNTTIQLHLDYVEQQLREHYHKNHISRLTSRVIAKKMGNKIRYRFLGQQKKFKSLIQARTLDHFINRFDKALFKSCFIYRNRKKRFAVMYRLEQCYLHWPIVEQAIKDELYHTLPFVIAFGQSPAVLKKQFGCSVWKKLCSHSLSRNLCILAAAEHVAVDLTNELNHQNDDFLPLMIECLHYDSPEFSAFTQYLYEVVPFVTTLRTGLLTNKFFTHELIYARTPGVMTCWSWVNKNAKVSKVQSVRELFNLSRDTQKYTTINQQWSIRRMREEHDAGVRQANQERLLSLASKYQDKQYHEPLFQTQVSEQIGDIQIKLLNSEFDYVTESVEMSHCIYDAYWEYALDKSIVSFSLRSPNQRSTIAFKFVPHKKELHNKPFQHYGHHNGAIFCPSLKRIRRLKGFGELLNSLARERFGLDDTTPTPVLTTIRLFQETANV